MIENNLSLTYGELCILNDLLTKHFFELLLEDKDYVKLVKSVDEKIKKLRQAKVWR